jgi:hypothetical protein
VERGPRQVRHQVQVRGPGRGFGTPEASGPRPASSSSRKGTGRISPRDKVCCPWELRGARAYTLQPSLLGA